jgi:hypothetical protein
LLTLGSAAICAAQPSPVPRVHVAAIEPAASGETTIVLESRTPLPRPVIGVLDGPPRIYLDFAGFRPETSSIPSPAEGVVRGVRIALHSADPPLTRVVIDLREPTRHRLDATAATSGRLSIVVGGSASRAAVSLVVGTPSPAPPQGIARLRAILTQFDALTPLLKAIDTQSETTAVSLQAALVQLDALVDALRGVRSTRPSRDRLAQAAALALQAVKARLENATSANAALTWNAASAAAGALLLLDSARDDLGMPRSSRP